jgi:hypothetical protein
MDEINGKRKIFMSKYVDIYQEKQVDATPFEMGEFVFVEPEKEERPKQKVGFNYAQLVLLQFFFSGILTGVGAAIILFYLKKDILSFQAVLFIGVAIIGWIAATYLKARN